MVSHLHGAVIRNVTDRYAHFAPGSEVYVVKAHLWRNENAAFLELGSELGRNVWCCDHNIALRPLLIGNLSKAVGKNSLMFIANGVQLNFPIIRPPHNWPKYFVSHEPPP